MKVNTPWGTQILVERHKGHSPQSVHGGGRGKGGGGAPSLPQDLRKASSKQLGQAAKHLAKTKTTKQLRKDQGVNQAATKTAHKNYGKKPSKENERTLSNSQIQGKIITAAIDIKEFGD
jgi:hypothetical protein